MDSRLRGNDKIDLISSSLGVQEWQRNANTAALQISEQQALLGIPMGAMSMQVWIRLIACFVTRKTTASQALPAIQMDVTSMAVTGSIAFIADQQALAIRALQAILTSVTNDKS